jgi:hypothetical protein
MGSKAGEVAATVAALFVMWAMIRGALKNILDAIKVFSFLAGVGFVGFGIYSFTQSGQRMAGPFFLGIAAVCFVVHHLLSPAKRN